MIFNLRQRQDLFVIFTNLIKAFDTVSMDAIWVVLRKLVIPERMLSDIMSFHQRTLVSVRSSGVGARPHSLFLMEQNKVVFLKLSYLFCVFLSWMKQFLRIVKKVEDLSSRQVVHCSTNNVSKQHLRRLCDPARDLLFTDDSALIAHTLENMQGIVKKFSRAFKAFG